MSTSEVRQDDDDGDEHDEVLHDGVVAPEDGLHEEAGEAGKVEHRLRDDEPADQEGELDPDDRDHGQDGVLERVAPDDDALGLALGPRRADVVLAQHLEQGRARDPHDERRGAVAHREGGQHELDGVQARSSRSSARR